MFLSQALFVLPLSRTLCPSHGWPLLVTGSQFKFWLFKKVCLDLVMPTSVVHAIPPLILSGLVHRFVSYVLPCSTPLSKMEFHASTPTTALVSEPNQPLGNALSPLVAAQVWHYLVKGGLCARVGHANLALTVVCLTGLLAGTRT